jgi:hypothetical protein
MAQAIFESNLFPYDTPTFLKPSSFYTHLPGYEDGTVCSETSAYKLRTPGNYPEESIQHSEHGESLKSRTLKVLSTKVWIKAWIISEVINVELHLKNMIRKDGRCWVRHEHSTLCDWRNNREKLSTVMHNWLYFILTSTGDALSLVSSHFFVLCCHSFILLPLCPFGSRPECPTHNFPSYWLTKLGNWWRDQ